MQLPKQDHYEIAREAALRRLDGKMDAERLNRLGARLADDGTTMTLPVLCWELRVQTAPLAMSLLPDGEQVALPWQILALDYLGANEVVAPRTFVSFADLPEGRGYQSAFDSRVIGRLARTVGRDRQAFVRAAGRLGAVPVEGDPLYCIFRVFPLLEFQVLHYEGNAEFPPSCNVLFPDNTLRIFTLEDAIVAAERLVAALEGKSPAARRQG